MMPGGGVNLLPIFYTFRGGTAQKHTEPRMYFRRKTSAGRAYLQIVASRREGEKIRQQVIATLGRYDELQASGQVERLLRSDARFAAKAMVLSAVADDSAVQIASRRIGPATGRHVGDVREVIRLRKRARPEPG
jgi:hypothetical protein